MMYFVKGFSNYHHLRMNSFINSIALKNNVFPGRTRDVSKRLVISRCHHFNVSQPVAAFTSIGYIAIFPLAQNNDTESIK